MGCQEVESFSRAKGNQRFSFVLQGAYQNHCQNNNIGVNNVDEDLLTIWAAWVTCNLMLLIASLWFQGARAEVSRSDAQGVIFFHDDQLLACKLKWFMEDAREEAKQLCLVLVDSQEAGPVPRDHCTSQRHPFTTRLLTPFFYLALAVPFNESVM